MRKRITNIQNTSDESAFEMSANQDEMFAFSDAQIDILKNVIFDAVKKAVRDCFDKQLSPELSKIQQSIDDISNKVDGLMTRLGDFESNRMIKKLQAKPDSIDDVDKDALNENAEITQVAKEDTHSNCNKKELIKETEELDVFEAIEHVQARPLISPTLAPPESLVPEVTTYKTIDPLQNQVENDALDKHNALHDMSKVSKQTQLPPQQHNQSTGLYGPAPSSAVVSGPGGQQMPGATQSQVPGPSQSAQNVAIQSQGQQQMVGRNQTPMTVYYGQRTAGQRSMHPPMPRPINPAMTIPSQQANPTAQFQNPCIYPTNPLNPYIQTHPQAQMQMGPLIGFTQRGQYASAPQYTVPSSQQVYFQNPPGSYSSYVPAPSFIPPLFQQLPMQPQNRPPNINQMSQGAKVPEQKKTQKKIITIQNPDCGEDLTEQIMSNATTSSPPMNISSTLKKMPSPESVSNGTVSPTLALPSESLVPEATTTETIVSLRNLVENDAVDKHNEEIAQKSNVSAATEEMLPLLIKPARPQIKLLNKDNNDRWSPTNPEGKKQYDREFLLKLSEQPLSICKPEGLPNLDIVKFSNQWVQKRAETTQVEKKKKKVKQDKNKQKKENEKGVVDKETVEDIVSTIAARLAAQFTVQRRATVENGDAMTTEQKKTQKKVIEIPDPTTLPISLQEMEKID